MTLSHYIDMSASERSSLSWGNFLPEKYVGRWIQLQKKDKKGFLIFLVKQYEEPFHRIESYGFKHIHAWVDLTKCNFEQTREQADAQLVPIEDETEEELQWRGGRQPTLLVAPDFTHMRRKQMLQGLRLQKRAWSPTELGLGFLKASNRARRSETSSADSPQRLWSPTELGFSFRFSKAREEDARSSETSSADSPVLANQDEAVHTFWQSQPIEHLSDGPIQTSSLVKKKPEKIGADHEWTTLDLSSDAVLSEVCKLLVEHDYEGDGKFRYANPGDFLRWALRPPGYYQSWHIGIRVKKSLVACLFGVPARIIVRDNEAVKVAAVRFLCVQKDFRSKGLVPIMIKEMIRRVNLKDIWQGAFCTDLLVATPVTTIRQWIRMLNPANVSKFLGEAMSIKDATKLYELPNAPVTPGFRKMVQSDVHAVTELLRVYLLEFEVAAEFREEDVKNWLLPKNNVVDCYVVEDPETHVVTDCCSFYTISFTVGGRKNVQMKGAYSYYNVATKTPLVQLIRDILIICRQNKFDIFHAKDVMDNKTFFEQLKFEEVGAQNHFYLFNQRLRTGLQPSQLGLTLF
ncbi:glycylpeptide N-tetradecanoyltransferase 1 [Brassica napus]|uniref:glycylpeptide N-tetradecanoyltransferase 1 n=1 Tax=Brassica napus TaxID=3708 RepID=UPI0006AB383C|nr:glycylpeptide N-tetradecanoyltransferase 1 [Brassica napus]XP_022557339.1 glycylpeptide N-tetradecanoyltransferase 1 [Brassica napus]